MEVSTGRLGTMIKKEKAQDKYVVKTGGFIGSTVDC